MHLLAVSFLAGLLTVAAPCILPLLPVIVGGATARAKGTRYSWHPVIITTSLAISVVVFTLALKATTALLGIPQVFWSILSGTIVLGLGVTMIFPRFWEWIAIKSGLYGRSNRALNFSSKRGDGVVKDVLIGASLGPVFASCSPTYALIIAVVLPGSFIRGLSYIIAYALGLAAMLLVIAIAGQSLIRKLGWLSNPSGWFKRIVGGLFIVVGIAVLTGTDRRIQAFVLQKGWYDPVRNLEQSVQ